MSATMTNSRPERKQPSDQLDRLDSILDGLADALNESVRDASRAGVREAVKEAVVELLTSADLRSALHQASALDVEPKPLSLPTTFQVSIVELHVLDRFVVLLFGWSRRRSGARGAEFAAS